MTFLWRTRPLDSQFPFLTKFYESRGIYPHVITEPVRITFFVVNIEKTKNHFIRDIYTAAIFVVNLESNH